MKTMERHDTARFEELLAAVLEGAATEAERAEFGRLLDASPERVEAYMRQARMHVMLEACAGLREQRAEDGGRRTEGGGARFWVRRWHVAAAAAAAAVLLAGLAVWRLSAPPSASVATVRASRHGQWADGREVAEGTALHAGYWMLQSGLVELVMRGDTVLLVEAPASFEIVDAMHARLLAGKLVVRMPKGRSGFVVDTPELHVQDLGTEFGVSVSSGGESQLQVFDGKVRAETAGSAVRRELRAGETVKSTTAGGLVDEAYDEKRFIRRFPPVVIPGRLSGALYSRSRVETVRVAYADRTVVPDGELGEWGRSQGFRSVCEAPYAEDYWLEGRMMYDATNLYLAAHVGDPDPMRNVAPEGFEFAGGSVIVRVSSDKMQGWPLKGSLFVNGAYDYSQSRIGAEARSDRIASIVMWYDAQARRARIKVIYGLDGHGKQIDPPGWAGVFRKDADGRGYALEYVIPWRLLNCGDDPPRGGDALAAMWMAHWSDAEGRLARGQLVEVTNHQPHPLDTLPPFIYFQNGPSWGRAVYLPKGE